MSETMEDGWECPETIEEEREYSKARQRDKEMRDFNRKKT